MDHQMRLMGVAAALVALMPVGLLLTSAADLPFPSVLRLERAEHLKGATLKQLVQWDMAQHASRRLLLGGAQDIDEIVQLPVLGSIYHYAGSPFLTQVSLGNPAKSFTVLVDSGSSTLWVSCMPCTGCPAPGKYRHSYDPSTSWSSSVFSVSDDWCGASIRRGFASRADSDHQNGRCGYSIVYGGGSTTAGYYVSDDIHFNATGQDAANLSSPIVFGCGNLQTGDLTDSGLGFDGILGIGPGENSINSQLNLLGLAPNVLSLCLKSTDNGEGVLAFGEAVVPGLVYTPLVPSKSYYSLILEGISVNSIMLPIDPSVFVSHKRQTVADSGTTLAYLADEAYNPFINAIRAAVAPSVRPVANGGEHCFIASGSLESLFPSVALHFSGGAVMMLKPRNYLLQESLMDDHVTVCIGWKRHQSQQLTILGDIVLMDKIIVHDLDNMRLGWIDFDCSQSINITTSHHWKQRHTNSGNAYVVLLTTTAIAVILTTMIMFCN